MDTFSGLGAAADGAVAVASGLVSVDADVVAVADAVVEIGEVDEQAVAVAISTTVTAIGKRR